MESLLKALSNMKLSSSVLLLPLFLPLIKWQFISMMLVSSNLNLTITAPLLPALPPNPVLIFVVFSSLILLKSFYLTKRPMKQPTMDFAITQTYLSSGSLVLLTLSIAYLSSFSHSPILTLFLPWKMLNEFSLTISYKPITRISLNNGYTNWDLRCDAINLRFEDRN